MELFAEIFSYMSSVCTAAALVCSTTFAAQYWLWKKYIKKVETAVDTASGAVDKVEDIAN